ncbi:MAG: hypothetical protein AAFX54_17875 [Pseudomonadota bacterium]
MTKETTHTSKKPAYRLGFAPRTGTDNNGQPTLGYPIEIGAVFERREVEKGLIAKFQIVPTDLKDGVLFLMPLRSEPDLLTGSEGTAS